MSRDSSDLRTRLSALEGKSYNLYKTVKGDYDFGGYALRIDHVQGDPFAEPSKIRALLPQALAGFPKSLFHNKSREIALRHFLTQLFYNGASQESRSIGSGKGGLITVDPPGQQILERTSCFVDDETIELRFLVGLPANGRRILGYQAADILCNTVPKLVSHSLLYENLDRAAIEKIVETAEDADHLRRQLFKRGLIAFIADGSILPRRSGIDDRPMLGDPVVFKSPMSLKVEIDLPNKGVITGMGLPAGITLIVGGGYHGKSTLLRALEKGVYNHIPGDGREFAVTDAASVKIRAEDGRNVCGVDISPFINNLPFGQKTQAFSTSNASGSTSQSAAIIEAIECDAKVLLIDEDTSATNFMIRDRRMQELIAKAKEPITPFTDRVRQIWVDHGVSTVLVMGGSGDYFDDADTIIAMENYQPREVTKVGKAIAKAHQTGRNNEGVGHFDPCTERRPLPVSFVAKRGRRDVHIKVRHARTLEIGDQEIDVSFVEQLVHTSQMRAIGEAIALIGKGWADGKTPLANILLHVDRVLQEEGLAYLGRGPVGNLAHFRLFDLAAVVNRMRGLRLASLSDR